MTSMSQVIPEEDKWPATPGEDNEGEMSAGDPPGKPTTPADTNGWQHTKVMVDDQKTHILAGGDWARTGVVHKAGEIYIGVHIVPCQTRVDH